MDSIGVYNFDSWNNSLILCMISYDNVLISKVGVADRIV